MTNDRAVVDAMADHLMHRYGGTFASRPAALGCAQSMIALAKIVSKPRRLFTFGRRAAAPCSNLDSPAERLALVRLTLDAILANPGDAEAYAKAGIDFIDSPSAKRAVLLGEIDSQ